MSAIFFHSPSFLQNDGTSSTMIISWQHKWISLAILSGLIFLFRFHIMGWILSRFICYNLAKTLIKQRIDVKVQQVKLRPIQLIQMEIFSEKGWRIQFSKISIHSHFTEFFRSFGHKKIIMLELDEVRVKVENIDEEWLLEEHKIHQEKEERQEKIQQISSSSFTSTATSTKRKYTY
jgi:hypothetical protein